MPEPQNTESVRRTLAMYRSLEAEREKQRIDLAVATEAGEIDPDEPQIVERLRHTRNKKGKLAIDLSKADPDCASCGGTGRKPDRIIRDEAGEVSDRLPFICICVKRGGGVAKDMLEKMMERYAKADKRAKRRASQRQARSKAKKRKRARARRGGRTLH